MFGYVTANKPELKIREFARYKGYYCGLCHTLLENHGRRGQMTLTYDMTFLVILLSSLYEPKEEEMRKRCLIHPAKKQYMIQNEVSVYASDMNILLTYDHLKDDWDDERKISGFFGMKVFAAKKKKIEKKHKRQAEAIEKALKVWQSDGRIVCLERGCFSGDFTCFWFLPWQIYLYDGCLYGFGRRRKKRML